MQFIVYSIIAAIVVILDQVSKFFVLKYIPLYGDVPFLPGFLGLTYVQNTGAAFSSFEGMRWLFILIFALFTAALIWEYFRAPMAFTKLERVCIAFVYGGGLGNVIDRVRLGFVVDMIETQFMVFPVFNVADCFIVVGCFGLMLHLIFCNKAFWKEEKK